MKTFFVVVVFYAVCVIVSRVVAWILDSDPDRTLLYILLASVASIFVKVMKIEDKLQN